MRSRSQASGWGDLGDGTYANPVLPGDYSDPDVIRVGNDYWMITSTFQYSPGMAILHSRDLINWRHVGAAVSDVSVLGPEYRWDRMGRYNRGIYAGSIRHHANRYWLHFTTLDEGIFVTTAHHPAGPWSELHRLSDETGWDDPCPLWDDDGHAWLVASSPGREAWVTWLIPMSVDGTSIDLDSKIVIDDWQTSEGNKIYKHDGQYYLMHNEVRSAGNRLLVMMRSESLAGPWEKRVLLQGEGIDREREPNQGALVDHADGSWSLVTHHGRGGYADGRPVSVLPVQWVDGWPIAGTNDRAGRMTWRAPAPLASDVGHSSHTSSINNFSGPQLAPEWEWNHAPRPNSWSLSDGLVLRASRPLRPDDLHAVPSMLTRRIQGTTGSTATVHLHTGDLAQGQTAGLAILCRESSAIVVRRELNALRISTVGEQGGHGPSMHNEAVWLRAEIDHRDHVNYAYSLDGLDFEPLGNTGSASWSDYRGARIGLFSAGLADDTGAARFNAFRYRINPRDWAGRI